MTPAEAAAVLAVFEKAGDYGSLMWRVSDEVRLFVLCSDLFSWATADAEEIGAGDVCLLEQCLADLGKAGGEEYFAWLFAARKRELRPQKPCYEGMNEATAALFDACCTSQERAQADEEDATWWARAVRKYQISGSQVMILLGVILLVIGFVAKIAIIWTIGVIAVIAGAILAMLGMSGRAVGGRRHWF